MTTPPVSKPPFDVFLAGVTAWVSRLAGAIAKRHRLLDRDDVVQEIALRLLRYYHTFDPSRGKPTTWVAQVARTIEHRMTRRKRVQTVPLLYGDGNEFDVPDPRAGDPADHQAAEDELREVRDAVEDLDPRERRVLAGRFGMGGAERLTLDGVAEVMGICKERVRQIERGALRKLAEAVGVDPERVTATSKARTWRRRKAAA